MDNIRWPLVGVVMFLMVITLSVGIYRTFDDTYGFENKYELTDNVSGNTMNIGERLIVVADQALDGINTTESGVNSLLLGITNLAPNPATGLLDILGGLSSVAIGALKSVLVFVTAPFQVIGIVLEYYVDIPVVVTYFATILLIFVVFILVSLYLRSDV